jgi:hypothetical protein
MKHRRSVAVDLGFIAFSASMAGLSYFMSAKSFVATALFGGFASYLVIFDDSDSARRHGSMCRMLVGAAFGLSVSAIYRAPLLVWLVAAGAGAILGFAGSKWARYVS